MHEKKRRSVIKAFSWRFLATMTTMTLVFVMTGRADLTLTVGALDVVVKMILYYLHERAWNRLAWGKKRYAPFVLWLTGLSGSGKSTLAQAVSDELTRMQIPHEQIDGDVVRDIFPKTGFSKDDRNMHIRRVGFLAGMLEKNEVPVICSFISPYAESRQFVRERSKNFIEVYVSAPLSVCEERDPKGLYKKARAGEIKQFTGIDDPYEPPQSPELTVHTDQMDAEECAREIVSVLIHKKCIL